MNTIQHIPPQLSLPDRPAADLLRVRSTNK
jgi:hypothetical protein